MSILNTRCFNLPFHTSECSGFWFDLLLIFCVVCFVSIVLLLISYFRERTLIKAFNERMSRKAMIADADVMSKHKWKENPEFENMDQSELSKKMRDELSK